MLSSPKESFEYYEALVLHGVLLIASSLSDN